MLLKLNWSKFKFVEDKAKHVGGTKKLSWPNKRSLAVFTQN